MKKLTEKQSNILAYMVQYFGENQKFPTQKDTANHFGVMPNAINNHIHAMVKKGVISNEADKARSIKLVGYKAQLVEVAE
mgnify:FL=1